MKKIQTRALRSQIQSRIAELCGAFVYMAPKVITESKKLEENENLTTFR